MTTTLGRYSQALHQAISLEASPELHPIRQTGFQTSYQFSPRALPWLVYDLYVYQESNGGVGVSFGVSKESLPDVARHLGYDSPEELDGDLPEQDALGVKTLGLGDMTVVQDCYSAVLEGLRRRFVSIGPVSYVQFEADADDSSRVRFYRRFAQIVRKTFAFEGPVTEESDRQYVYFRIFREEPRTDEYQG